MYRYFQGYDDAQVYWCLDTETDIVQHVVADLSNLWADPLRSVIHGINQIQMALDRGEIVEIDYNPIGTDESEMSTVQRRAMTPLSTDDRERALQYLKEYDC